MSGRDNLRERAISAAVWTFIQSWGGQISSVVIFVTLARMLPPDAFGLFAYATALTALLQLAANAGLAQAVIRFDRLDPEHLDTAFWTQAALAAIIAAAIVLGAEPLAAVMGDDALAPILRWISLGFFFSALSSTHRAQMRRRLLMQPLAVRSLLANTVGGVVGVGMAFSGYGVWSLVGQYLCASFVGLVTVWQAAGWRPRLRFSFGHLREMAGFGLALAGSNLLRILTDRADRLLIGNLMGATALGLYVVGFRALRLLIGLISLPIAKVAMPVFARMQGDVARIEAAVERAANLNGLVTFPAIIGLAVLSPDLILLVFGEQWVESVPVMRLLAVYGLCQAIYSLSGPIIVAGGQARWALLISAMSAFVTVVGVLMTYRWGLVAVAGVIALRGLVELPAWLFGCSQLLGSSMRSLLVPYRMPFLASVAMSGVCLLSGRVLAEAGLGLRLAVEVAAGAAVYTAIVLLAAPHRVRELLALARQSRGNRGIASISPDESEIHS